MKPHALAVLCLWLAALLCPGSPFGTVAAAQEAPVITTPPAPLSLRPGSSAALTVTATGTEPLNYQWYRGPSGDTSSPVNGATGPLLVTPALRETTSFWVRVTNTAGPANSPAASVTIAPTSTASALFAFGRNSSGQLGDGSTTHRSTPVLIATDVVYASTGGYDYLDQGQSHFIKSDASLWAMGDNYWGQLGDGSTTSRSTPVPVPLATGVASVSTGASHTLFVKTDGSLWGMGSNSLRQLDAGSTANRLSPVPIATGVATAIAGENYTLLIKTDGTLWAVGYNYYGQLGDGSTTTRTTPVKIADGVVSIAAGSEHSLFLKIDGSVWAMGSNSRAQLGDGTTTDRLVPVPVATGVASVSAGEDQSLFIKIDGSLWKIGYNNPWSSTDPSMVQIATGVRSADAGREHRLFVKTDDSLWALGENAYGQLGDGSTYDHETPVQIATGVALVSTCPAHTLIVGTPHTVTFDLGAHATRASGGELVQSVCQGTAANAPVLAVASGWAFTGWDRALTAVTTDLLVTAQYVVPTLPVVFNPPASTRVLPGSSAALSVGATANAPLAYQWYRGSSGDTSSPVNGAAGPLLVTSPLTAPASFWVRVGNADLFVDSPSAGVTLGAPAEGFGVFALGAAYRNLYGWETVPGAVNLLPGAAGVTTFSARISSVFFVKTDATLWAMGANNYGQLGDGTTTDRPSPVQIATDVASVATSGTHTLFIKTDGSLWAMGDNYDGQLGDGTTTERHTPVLIATGVRSVVADNQYDSFFIKTDDSLWAMGSNFYGKLGDVTYTPRPTTPVPVATGVVSVASGYYRSYFVKTDGTLWGMGMGIMPEDTDPWPWDPIPVQVGTGVASVAMSTQSTLFVKTDGSLWAMGSNYDGQLGDGTTTDRAQPVPITTDVVSVCSGAGKTLFRKTDDSLWGMGYNFRGRLGNSPDGILATPVLLATGVHFAQGGTGDSFFLKPLSFPLSFPTWAATHGLTTPVATALADPDADGTPNLLEYAFGTSPVAAGPAGTAVPSATLETVGDQPALVLTHRRRKDAQVTISYQQSLDLADPLAWTPVSLTPVVIAPDADGDGLVELVSVSVPLPTGADPRLFLRLVATE